MEGCRTLSSATVGYADGSEDWVLAALAQAQDLTSGSEELAALPRTWAQTYHLSPARANILRPLAWREDWRVLEVGAGCGAITRFLGERCRVVDALEPVAIRARAAHQRTRDLTGVEVFVGMVGDVPAQPAYDAIVVVGVLEYVGAGSADREPYLAFLRTLAGLLADGGSLVLAIENKLGVKYLCGAPEDHTGRPFESLEGYEPGSPARTFSRWELEALFRDAGLRPGVLGAFPDYKLTRSVHGDQLLAAHPGLARRIPQFPSPDWGGGPPRLASEARVWATLIDGGWAGKAANSFLVLAGRDGDTGPGLWPDGLLAAYYSGTTWRARYAMETRVTTEGTATWFRRRRLRPDLEDDSLFDLRDSPLVDGADLVDVMAAAADDHALADLLGRWVQALDAALAEGALAPLDCMPHNAVIDAAGRVSFVDAKWRGPALGRQDLLARGALLTAARLCVVTPPHRWPVGTLEGLTLHLGALLGLPAGGAWLAGAVQHEAQFQTAVSALPPDVDGEGSDEDRMREAIQRGLARSLLACWGGETLAEHRRGRLEAELARVSALLAQARAHGDAQAAQVAEFQRHCAGLEELVAALGARARQAEVAGAAAAESAAQVVAQAAARAAEQAAELQARAARAEAQAAELSEANRALQATRIFRYAAALRRIYASLRR